MWPGLWASGCRSCSWLRVSHRPHTPLCARPHSSATPLLLNPARRCCPAELEDKKFLKMDDLSNKMGLFLQKTNVIRDYLEVLRHL